MLIRKLCGENFNINNLSNADDTQLMEHLLSSESRTIYCKNAGTVLRFLTAYYAADNKEILITGDERMLLRPIAPLVDALETIGADISYTKKENYPPLLIKGKRLVGGKIKIDGSISSQFVSALMMIAPTLERGLEIKILNENVSAPYIHITQKLMEYFGVTIERQSENIITIPPQKYKPCNVSIEADWSSASYFLAALSVIKKGEFVFPDLSKNSLQGDAVLTEIFTLHFGLGFYFDEYGCTAVYNGKNVSKEFHYNLIHHPDVIPALVVMCCLLRIPFIITGSKTLKDKESHRAEVLKTELIKFGCKISVSENEMSWNGEKKQTADPSNINTHHDHRMAMSFALLQLVNPSIKIDEPSVVDKSFPLFWEEWYKIKNIEH